MKTTVKIITSILLILIVGVSSIYYINTRNVFYDQLSEEVIAELREEYPVCGIKSPPNLFLLRRDLSEVKELTETFVYGKVIGEMSIYQVEARLSNEALREKRNANGINDIFEHYEYTISVIGDTEGIYSGGETITIAANADFMEYNPKLKDGMKVVVPIIRDKRVKGRTSYTVNGMYYVTDDDYAITAFDETKNGKRVLNGVKVDVLMKELKK